MARPKIKTNARNRPGKKTRKTARKPAKISKPAKSAGKRSARAGSKPTVQPGPVVDLAPCHFCKKDVKKDDMFCFGCMTVICDECDVSMGGFGHGHSPDDHLVSSYDD